MEKPVAGSVKDILESHAVCRANNVPLYCSFQRCVLRYRVVYAHRLVVRKAHGRQ